MSKNIVALTACPTGVAHTFMAAEALEEEAKKRADELMALAQKVDASQKAEMSAKAALAEKEASLAKQASDKAAQVAKMAEESKQAADLAVQKALEEQKKTLAIQEGRGQTVNFGPVPDANSVLLANLSFENVIASLTKGRAIVAQEDLPLLDNQSSLNISGEPSVWVEPGRGYALKAVTASQKDGVVCRFIQNGQYVVGNMYVNAIESEHAKRGDPICRAATNTDNMVYLTNKNYHILTVRGDASYRWLPVASTKKSDWETGYATKEVGDEITENTMTFKGVGVCRQAKDSANSDFHVGRLELDALNNPVCYLKKRGMQHVISGDQLATVEVLIRPAKNQILGDQGISILAQLGRSDTIMMDRQLPQLAQMQKN